MWGRLQPSPDFSPAKPAPVETGAQDKSCPTFRRVLSNARAKIASSVPLGCAVSGASTWPGAATSMESSIGICIGSMLQMHSNGSRVWGPESHRLPFVGASIWMTNSFDISSSPVVLSYVNRYAIQCTAITGCEDPEGLHVVCGHAKLELIDTD